MERNWYKKMMKNMPTVDSPVDFHDLPTLAKQNSDLNYQELGSISRGDSDILGCGGPRDFDNEDNESYMWFQQNTNEQYCAPEDNIEKEIPNPEIQRVEEELTPIQEEPTSNMDFIVPDDIPDDIRLSPLESEKNLGVEKPLKKRKVEKPIKSSSPQKKRKTSATLRSSTKSSFLKDLDSDEDELLPHNKKMLEMMTSIFQGKNIDKELLSDLDKGERIVLTSIMKRKFNLSIKQSMSNEDICAKINSERNNAKAKRLEENYKLVFKKALKFLLNDFKSKNKLKLRKYELEQQFYNFYFKEIFEKEGINDFVYLNGGKEKRKKGGQCLFNPKTINIKYVVSIMKSKAFFDDFVEYVNENFIDDYETTINFKIGKVLEKCSSYLEEGDKGYAEVKEYIELNSKCKLPWSTHELEIAKQSVMHLLNDKLNDRQIEQLP